MKQKTLFQLTLILFLSLSGSMFAQHSNALKEGYTHPSSSFRSASTVSGKILYFTDYVLGVDHMDSAIVKSGNDYTIASSFDNFSSELRTGNYKLAVLFVQNSAVDTTVALQLDTFVTNGGYAIFSDWDSNDDGTYLSKFGASYTLSTNFDTVTVTDPIFGTLNSKHALVNSGWGIFSNSMTVTDATSKVCATFQDGNAAIIVGKSNHTIVFGFTNDTPSDSLLFSKGISYLMEQSTAGVKNSLAANSDLIYPNPTADEISISNPEGVKNIVIRNVLGQTVWTGSKTTITVSSWPKGVYFVHYEKGGQTVSAKFIKK
jgi:hypothetical protein